MGVVVVRDAATATDVTLDHRERVRKILTSYSSAPQSKPLSYIGRTQQEA